MGEMSPRASPWKCEAEGSVRDTATRGNSIEHERPKGVAGIAQDWHPRTHVCISPGMVEGTSPPSPYPTHKSNPTPPRIRPEPLTVLSLQCREHVEPLLPSALTDRVDRPAAMGREAGTKD